jgi:hypothetical protein
MQNKNKTTVKYAKFFGLIIATLSFSVFFFASPAQAGEITGWVGSWSDDGNVNPAGFGWLSMNSNNCDGNDDGRSDGTIIGCPASGTVISKYSVSIPGSSGGDFIEPSYAWSPNIGWISFNKADLAGCPETDQTKCSARRTGDNLEGWARILSFCDGDKDGNCQSNETNANAGGWGGWIKLRHTGSSGAKTCQSGPRTGQSCSNNGDCQETTQCGGNSPISVSGRVEPQEPVSVRLRGNGNRIEIYGNGGGGYTGSITLDGCTVSGDVQTWSDRVDVRLQGTGNEIKIFGSGGQAYSGSLNLSGCTVTGNVQTDSDNNHKNPSFAMRGVGNRINIYEKSEEEYVCPIAGEICVNGFLNKICNTTQEVECVLQNPKDVSVGNLTFSPEAGSCSVSHICVETGSPSVNYGVSIVTSTSGTGGLGGEYLCGDERTECGYAWSNEIGWLKFDPELVYFKKPRVTLSANPLDRLLSRGQVVEPSKPIINGSELSWTVSGADSCQATGWTWSDSNLTNGAGSGNTSVNLTSRSGVNTFSLKCYNADAYTEASVNVNTYCNKRSCQPEATGSPENVCKTDIVIRGSWDEEECSEKCSNHFQCKPFEWQEKSPS